MFSPFVLCISNSFLRTNQTFFNDSSQRFEQLRVWSLLTDLITLSLTHAYGVFYFFHRQIVNELNKNLIFGHGIFFIETRYIHLSVQCLSILYVYPSIYQSFIFYPSIRRSIHYPPIHPQIICLSTLQFTYPSTYPSLNKSIILSIYMSISFIYPSIHSFDSSSFSTIFLAENINLSIYTYS